MKKSEKPENTSRREFVRKAAYVAPAIVTLAVLPAHQAVGSVRPNGNHGRPHGRPRGPF
jgi:hypothetical protein